MTTAIVIIGAGGFGREVLDVVEAMNSVHKKWEFLGFLDDGAPDHELVARRGARVLGPTEALAQIDARYVIGVGAGKERRMVDELASAMGRQPATLVHPSATMGGAVELGPGCIVCAHASLTTNIRLGRHVDVHVGTTVGHDSVLDDYVSVFPGASIGGHVSLSKGVTVGSGATIIQGLSVGQEAIVGAGAAVVGDVDEGTTVVGVPARSLSA